MSSSRYSTIIWTPYAPAILLGSVLYEPAVLRFPNEMAKALEAAKVRMTKLAEQRITKAMPVACRLVGFRKRSRPPTNSDAEAVHHVTAALRYAELQGPKGMLVRMRADIRPRCNQHTREKMVPVEISGAVGNDPWSFIAYACQRKACCRHYDIFHGYFEILGAGSLDWLGPKYCARTTDRRCTWIKQLRWSVRPALTNAPNLAAGADMKSDTGPDAEK
jgi:hypothetical protein